MNSEELMVGDWVLYGKKPVRILQLSEGKDYKEIRPIPLTQEILEKNGFYYCKRTGGCYLYTTISYGNWDAEVVLFDVNSEYRNNQLHIGSPDDSDTFLHLMECNYVHELQHALRLCGIDKTIEL